MGRQIAGSLYAALPAPGITRPVFIIGCGRSGTTILGTALSKHSAVTYLDEPRRLWFSAYPETDIWTPEASSRHGKLVLTDADVEQWRSEKMSRLLRFEALINRGPVLVEKLPINSFRARFIHEMFPDARFIHIYRNGLEVARSIEKLSACGRWDGAASYKWRKLVEHAGSRDDTKNLPALCSSYFDRGLLEWRLSTEAAVEFLRHLPDEAFLELTYAAFLERPVDAISSVLDFIGIDESPEVEDFVSENVRRRTGKLGQRTLSEKEQLLGGRLLPLSMNGAKGLTKRCT